jgi:hypothetical protein
VQTPGMDSCRLPQSDVEGSDEKSPIAILAASLAA